MPTLLNIRNLGLFKGSRRSRAIGLIGVVATSLSLTAALVGSQIYQKLTNNTVVAYFPTAVALYPGDKVQILGVQVGTIDKIEPVGDQMKVTFHYRNSHPVSASTAASIVNPSLVASREIQLSPPDDNGPELKDGAVIPIERTQVPVEWDDLRDQISRLLTELGPTPQRPKGPLGDVIESLSDGLAGKGKQINDTLTALADAVTTVNEGRGDIFAVVRNLARFVNALRLNDQQFVELNSDLAQFTNAFTHSDDEFGRTLQALDRLLPAARKFITDNGSTLAHDISNLSETTNALLQPEPRDGLETVLHVLPNQAVNAANTYEPAHGASAALLTFPNFANPLQFICSSIQAASRLGYQESAELCAQYLAPVLDATKFNYFPFGADLFGTANALPQNVRYSEPRLQPPPGYKDTTVPGVWSPDTVFSHGNHQPGWILGPGMQGVDLQAPSADMLTPQSLSELLAGADVSSPAPRTATPNPANAADQTSPSPSAGSPPSALTPAPPVSTGAGAR